MDQMSLSASLTLKLLFGKMTIFRGRLKLVKQGRVKADIELLITHMTVL